MDNFKKQFTPRELEIFDKVRKILIQRLKPGKIIFFGSRVKGSARHGSDFDFAVDRKRPPTMEEFEMMGQIEGVSGLYQVDIIYLPNTDTAFKKIILGTGKVIYERKR